MGDTKNSKAFDLMLKRKRLLMKSRHIDRELDEEKFLEVRKKAADLAEEADKLGGLTSEESYALSFLR